MQAWPLLTILEIKLLQARSPLLFLKMIRNYYFVLFHFN